MSAKILAFCVLLLASLSTGCATIRAISPSPKTADCDSPECSKSIYVIRHGWHTGIAIKRSDISFCQWPEIQSLCDCEFVEVGWGDEGYLRSRFPNPVVMANAAVLPSRSAIHVVGLPCSPEKYFSESQVVKIPVSSSQMTKLCQHLHECYASDDGDRPQKVARPKYGHGNGGVYRANGYYFLPNTCNVWTARALRAADCPVIVPLCVLSRPTMIQTKCIGTEINQGSDILPVLYPFVNFKRPGSP